MESRSAPTVFRRSLPLLVAVPNQANVVQHPFAASTIPPIGSIGNKQVLTAQPEAGNEWWSAGMDEKQGLAWSGETSALLRLGYARIPTPTPVSRGFWIPYLSRRSVFLSCGRSPVVEGVR